MANDLLPCPFCGSKIRHVDSWAKSFNPARLYHEWHHDETFCQIHPQGRGTMVADATDDPEMQARAIERWNTRSGTTPDVRADAIEECAKVAHDRRAKHNKSITANSLVHPGTIDIFVTRESEAQIIEQAIRALAIQDAPTREARQQKNEREMAEGARCDGSCNDGAPCHCATTLAANSAHVEAMLSIVKSAYYSEPTGTAENAWNDALQHIEEGFSALQQSPPQGETT